MESLNNDVDGILTTIITEWYLGGHSFIFISLSRLGKVHFIFAEMNKRKELTLCPISTRKLWISLISHFQSWCNWFHHSFFSQYIEMIQKLLSLYRPTDRSSAGRIQWLINCIAFDFDCIVSGLICRYNLRQQVPKLIILFQP